MLHLKIGGTRQALLNTHKRGLCILGRANKASSQRRRVLPTPWASRGGREARAEVCIAAGLQKACWAHRTQQVAAACAVGNGLAQGNQLWRVFVPGVELFSAEPF